VPTVVALNRIQLGARLRKEKNFWWEDPGIIVNSSEATLERDLSGEPTPTSTTNKKKKIVEGRFGDPRHGRKNKK